MNKYRKGTIVVFTAYGSDAFERYHLVCDERPYEDGGALLKLIFLSQTLNVNAPYSGHSSILEHQHELLSLLKDFPNHNIPRFHGQQTKSFDSRVIDCHRSYSTLEDYLDKLRFYGTPQDTIDGLKRLQQKLYDSLALPAANQSL